MIRLTRYQRLVLGVASVDQSRRRAAELYNDLALIRRGREERDRHRAAVMELAIEDALRAKGLRAETTN
jgi:hypothetical protein